MDNPLSFQLVMRELDNLFDNQENMDSPLEDREKITAFLEKLLYKIVSSLNPDTFLEIGAFEADFSREMKKCYPDSNVIALEANPRVYEKFLAEVKEIGVNYIHAAASAEIGTVSFYIPEMVAGKEMPYTGRMGSLREIGLRDSKTTKVTVPATTLDQILTNYEHKNICLWIDVEGAIDEVLKGATKTLANTDLLYCEIESSPVWKQQVLAPEVLDIISNSGLIPVARDCQKSFQKNILFISDRFKRNPEFVKFVNDYLTEVKTFFDFKKN